jgi:hypothetical protein
MLQVKRAGVLALEIARRRVCGRGLSQEVKRVIDGEKAVVLLRGGLDSKTTLAIRSERRLSVLRAHVPLWPASRGRDRSGRAPSPNRLGRKSTCWWTSGSRCNRREDSQLWRLCVSCLGSQRGAGELGAPKDGSIQLSSTGVLSVRTSAE